MNGLIPSSGHLVCTVTSPQKENEGSKDPYVSYLVTTETDIKYFSKPHLLVRRRFSDFAFLHDVLCREFLDRAVPPIPDKHRMGYVKGDRFDPNFTTRRCYSLHRFIRRLSLHPMLRRAKIFLSFLESTEWNLVMQTWGKERGPGANGSPGTSGDVGDVPGVLDSLTDTILNAFSKPLQVDPKFVLIEKQSEKLEDDLALVYKLISKVGKREEELEHDFADLATQFQKLMELEPGVASELASFTTSSEKMKTELKTLREQTELNYHTSLKDMESYAGSIRSLLREREKKQLDYEALTDYLCKAIDSRDSTSVNSSVYMNTRLSGFNRVSAFFQNKLDSARGVDAQASRRDRFHKLEEHILRLDREVNNAQAQSDMFDDRVVAEVEVFGKIREAEFQDTFTEFADAHIQFFDRTANIWQQLIDDIQKSSTGGEHSGTESGGHVGGQSGGRSGDHSITEISSAGSLNRTQPESHASGAPQGGREDSHNSHSSRTHHHRGNGSESSIGTFRARAHSSSFFSAASDTRPGTSNVPTQSGGPEDSSRHSTATTGSHSHAPLSPRAAADLFGYSPSSPYSRHHRFFDPPAPTSSPGLNRTSGARAGAEAAVSGTRYHHDRDDRYGGLDDKEAFDRHHYMPDNSGPGGTFPSSVSPPSPFGGFEHMYRTAGQGSGTTSAATETSSTSRRGKDKATAATSQSRDSRYSLFGKSDEHVGGGVDGSADLFGESP